MESDVKLKVNGVEKTVRTEPLRKLLEVLREDLHLTGTKYGCGEGQCRACLVLVDGKPSMSCLLPVKMAEGKSITTIEGLADGDTLHPVQQAFLEEQAMQCGYCTSGMIISATALLQENSDPSDEEIVQSMNGNLCRCNEYVKIIAAVRNAAQKLRKRRSE
jgi:aerobic-type carbon monoxide dehydrogenase small subunit (CoxS/CutS family)